MKPRTNLHSDPLHTCMQTHVAIRIESAHNTQIPGHMHKHIAQHGSCQPSPVLAIQTILFSLDDIIHSAASVTPLAPTATTSTSNTSSSRCQLLIQSHQVRGQATQDIIGEIGVDLSMATNLKQMGQIGPRWEAGYESNAGMCPYKVLRWSCWW